MAFEIYTYADLKKVGTGEDGWNLDSDYVLMNDIDASASQTENWNETRQVYEGWQNIGTWDTPFSGTFDGQGHKITGLHIDRQRDAIGLFGYVINTAPKNIHLVDIDYKAGKDNEYCYYIGGLIGYWLLDANTSVSLENCSVSGNIEGKNDVAYVGGLIGEIDGEWSENYEDMSITINNCYADVDINLDNPAYYIGGLIGYSNYEYNTISITNCYATGNIIATGNYKGYAIGGFLGEGTGVISNCYATGNIVGGEACGGFVGEYGGSSALIENCYATGNVTGQYDRCGGFVGINYGTIKKCKSSGNVSVPDNETWNDIGGFVGQNLYGAEINNCYSSGNASGYKNIGGFCGSNSQSKIYKSYSVGAVSGTSNVGGFCAEEETGGDYDTQDNFFDYQTAGNEVEIGATKKTTSQMKDISTYTVVGNGLTEPWDIAKRPTILCPCPSKVPEKGVSQVPMFCHPS